MEENYRIYTGKSEADKAIHMLEGILKGISYDSNINKMEVTDLNNWVNLHIEFSEKYPFNEVIEKINTILEDNIITEDEKEDLLWFCDKVTTGSQYYDIVTSDIQRLNGIIHGIISDKNIKDSEIEALKNWLHENEHLVSTYPYDELNTLISDVLEDGIITDEENQLLERFFLEFVDEKSLTAYSSSEIASIKESISISGICAIDPTINIKGSKFCFTGKSSETTRKGFMNIVESLEGKTTTDVSNKTDYLVIGDDENPCWAYACYGRKIEKAINIRRNGGKVVIVHENDFWDAVQDFC